MAKPKKTYDWESIEKEIEASQLSLREISRQYDCPYSSIKDRIKAKGLKRDISKKVARKVKEKLLRSLPLNNPPNNNARDEQLIEEAADRAVAVITLQRKDIKTLREHEEKLLEELGNNPTKLYIAQYQGKIIEKRSE